MKWIRRSRPAPIAPNPSPRQLFERGVLTYDGPCVCDMFDIGPRCGACVAACATKGHQLGTHPTGHPDYCFCGVPDGSDDPPSDLRTWPGLSGDA